MRLLALTAALALLPACRAERTLRVTSDPPGAKVYVDGEPVGPTPIDIEFQHYGTRRVLYRLEGYGATSLRVEIEPPWYGRFPLDLVSEVLLPLGWEDMHVVHAVLVEGEEHLTLPTLRSVLDRAETLRRAGPHGPGNLPPAVPSTPAAEAEEAEPEAGAGEPKGG